ncbi:hypothetical protein [Hymenobacter chitinivorans]|uniref:Lipoprotein n=1 Tax=Hymenobacter chitinivorans DSM 11115 TaxID=1121954 RepID=A0A2M9BMB6_9BACT|nr:hypothetical protein [Hymenobacter chitinivorans]PJJ59075.1 hypothetical protein CLV45_0488 [Hymenobacter chitinivorans DSM 11115]
MKTTLALGLLAGLLTACHSQPTEQPAAAATPPPAAAVAPAPDSAAEAEPEMGTMRALAQPLPPATEVVPGDSARARQWLIASIEENFADKVKEQQNSEEENPDGIYSLQYLTYKTDATWLAYTEGEGEKEARAQRAFEKKWGGRYDTRYVGTGGFLFTQENYGKAKVTQCRLKEQTPDPAFVFEVVIHDLKNQHDGKGDIKVVNTAQGYKIDDVREY